MGQVINSNQLVLVILLSPPSPPLLLFSSYCSPFLPSCWGETGVVYVEDSLPILVGVESPRPVAAPSRGLLAGIPW